MPGFPAPDRIDAATAGVVALLLVVSYGLFPGRLVRVAVWFSIIMLFVCWTGYFCYRAVFDEAQFWE